MVFFTISQFTNIFKVLQILDKFFFKDVEKFKSVARKKFLIQKQNNNKPQGKKCLLATVFEFVYFVTALVFSNSRIIAD